MKTGRRGRRPLQKRGVEDVAPYYDKSKIHTKNAPFSRCIFILFNHFASAAL